MASVSAGPPCGGLYLNPPSRGGLCDGVTTIPSARSAGLPRLCRRMAWLTAGVGVYRSRESMATTTSSGEEQSIRILPSWSRVMNRQVASTNGFTTVSSSDQRSAIAAQ
ncbi:Uncharacterised protein [Mycobacteroides abscessus subsp. abscessus]|nr:Uncharacterised protein [Mycobacteroides abscessus subsp. abscessus]